MPFSDGIARTVGWFQANEPWWRAIRSGEWDAYYARQYGTRLAGSTEAAG
jgi:dTDP-glucose 4,6-dehydratase